MENTLAGEEKKKVMKMIGVFLIIISIFFVVKTINEIKSGRTIGADSPAQNVISVSGEGEVYAVPDLATFSVTVRYQEETQDVAQDKVTAKMNEVIAYLESQGIEERDRKTTGYNLYPRYEYRTRTTATGGAVDLAYYPGDREQILVGYEVTHTLQVKVRDSEKAGEILAGVGSLQVDNVSGLQFTIDDEDELKREARQAAIADAKEKAELLADDLGVRLVRIVNFYENEGGYYPYANYDYAVMESAVAGKGGDAIAPQIELGENTVRSNVNITYEIR